MRKCSYLCTHVTVDKSEFKKLRQLRQRQRQKAVILLVNRGKNDRAARVVKSLHTSQKAHQAGAYLRFQ